jgi:hypothetical protein
MLPKGNTVSETVYEATQIICQLGLKVKKFTHARMIAFYSLGMSIKTLRNVLFVYSTDSIVEKMAVMTSTATEEMMGPKRCFSIILSFLV